jgi:hypothetical protein
LDWTKIGGSGLGEFVGDGCRDNSGPMRFSLSTTAHGGQSVGFDLATVDDAVSPAGARAPLPIVGWKASGTMNLGAATAVVFADRATFACSSGEGACPTNTTVPWNFDSNLPYPAGADVSNPNNETGRVAMAATLGCGAAATDTCGGASVDIVDNDVTYADAVAPTGGVSGGSLVASGFGSPLTGTASATVRGDDRGSGIKRFEAVVDGTAIAATPDRCAPPFDRKSPCPLTDGGTINLDTTKVADGTHALQIVAVDASDERAVIYAGQLIVGNGTTVGPGTDPNLRGAANGNYSGDDAKLSAGWSATGRKPSSSRRVMARCKASKSYRRRHKVACFGRPASTTLTTRYSSKRRNIVRGRLTNAVGQPIAGAAVQLVAVPRATGVSASIVATPTTDADGRFVATVPVASGSTRIAVNWFARVRDTVPATTGVLKRTVKASTTFAVFPRTTVRRGRVLRLRGRLTGRAGTPKGTAVALQANAGTSWRAVTTVRASASGRWAARYRVPTQLRGRYRFRAVVKPSAAYPYGTSSSSARRVRVR